MKTTADSEVGTSLRDVRRPLGERSLPASASEPKNAGSLALAATKGWLRLRRRAGLSALLLTTAISPLPAQPVPLREPIVVLPPFMVEERAKALKWHYHAAPGLEVLAACDPDLAVGIVERMIQLDQMMPVFIPTRFLAAGPETLILMDEDAGQGQAREVLAEAMKRSEVNFMPNLRLVDTDMSVVFASVRSGMSRSSMFTSSTSKLFSYTPDRLASLLEQRVPRLPDWFIEGVEGFYRQVGFRDNEIEIGPAIWISKEESEALRNDTGRPRVVVPMEEFFAQRKDRRAGADESEAEWRSQAALFVRWAMLDQPVLGSLGSLARERSERFGLRLWKFVDRLEREPASEPLFRECFGRGYADMRDELSDYLPRAVDQTTTIRVPPAAGEGPPPPKFRPATDLEVARLRGDWERLEIGYVRQNSPEVAGKYIGQARKTLARAYDRGERDPRLLAAMGLTELEAGNPEGARPLLEAAAAGHVVRPRVYHELARLRYAAIGNEIGSKAKLTAAQAAEVLELLTEGQRQNPPLLENYALFAEVVGRSTEPPTAAQLVALHEGALKFPQASDLVVRTIYFHLVSNQPAAAAALSEVGLRYARDPATRAKFERASASFSGAK